MAAQSSVITAAAAQGGIVQSSLLTALVERSAYVLKRTETLGDLTQPTGQVYLVVHSEATGYAYYYDPTDTTSADDGETVLVDFDGRRYIVADGAYINVSSVLDFEETPPVTPSNGDAYVVGAAPTGAWSGHANDITIYTPRGWIFATPQVGQTVLSEATETNYQYDAGGVWGGFIVEEAAGSIRPAALAFPMGVAIESTSNAPPGSPVDGQYYLVGTSPSGAYVGHANAVATYRNSAWEFIAAYDGAYVYEKTLSTGLVYQSGSWTVDASLLVPGVVKGLTISNNTLDATNDLDIAAGWAIDSAGLRVIRLASSITKRLDASWSVGSGNGGRDTGSIADAWWYVWLILRSDTGVVDVLLSQSASSPTMPANYDYKCRIGEAQRISSAIKAFVQDDDDFWWKTEVQDCSDAPSTSSTLKTLSVPPERLKAHLTIGAVQSSGSGISYVRIHDPNLDDFAPTSSVFTLAVASDGSRDAVGGGIDMMTNSSGQVRHRSSAAFTGNIYITTLGWKSKRGRP